MKLNTLAHLLLYSPLYGVPMYMGTKRGLKNMSEKYEPLDIRLSKVSPLSSKQASEKSNETFNEFKKEREKVAALVPIQNLVPSIIAGTAAAEGIGSIGKGIGGITSPITDVIGYKLFKKFFPGPEGMVEYTRAPEKALEMAAGTMGKSLGQTAAEGIQQFIGSVIGKNEQIINSSPRRKMILHQLRQEDDTIKSMPVKTVMEAYHSMSKIAPRLSTDKNAVRSFLRSVAVSPEGGIDWNTMKGLADAEVSVGKALGISSSK